MVSISGMKKLIQAQYELLGIEEPPVKFIMRFHLFRRERSTPTACRRLVAGSGEYEALYI